MIRNITALILCIGFTGLASYLRITKGAAPGPIVFGMLFSLPFAVVAIEDIYKAIHDRMYPKKFKIK